MTTDLWMLTLTSLLNLLLPMIAVIGLQLRPGGLEYGLGNRETQFPLADWAERGKRAHNNMTENLAIFAVLVLVAHVSGKANETTALASVVYFAARVAHAVVYTAGIKVVRTVVFFVGIGAELVILSQLFT